MDFQIYLASLFLLIALGNLDAAQVKFHSNLDDQWENFKKTFGKGYEADEEPMRKKHFESNLKKITEHNQRYELGMHSFQLGINEFADMIIEDFVKMMNGLKPRKSNAPIAFVVPDDAELPESVDWRNAGAVTPVKNQGQCGGCYAFSATGALEGQNKLRRNESVSLSEQNILDCSEREGNEGCNGGLMDDAFEYVMENKGLDSEKSYPYEAKTDKRCYYKQRNSAVTCEGYSDVIPRNEDTLQVAVATVGPISIGIDASQPSFQLYSGGIYNESLCSSTDIDHGVLCVGYGTENGADYWLVKNSWGTSWGEAGYIKMSRNKNNQCGIASQASFPVVLPYKA